MSEASPQSVVLGFRPNARGDAALANAIIETFKKSPEDVAMIYLRDPPLLKDKTDNDTALSATCERRSESITLCISPRKTNFLSVSFSEDRNTTTPEQAAINLAQDMDRLKAQLPPNISIRPSGVAHSIVFAVKIDPLLFIKTLFKATLISEKTFQKFLLGTYSHFDKNPSIFADALKNAGIISTQERPLLMKTLREHVPSEATRPPPKKKLTARIWDVLFN